MPRGDAELPIGSAWGGSIMALGLPRATSVNVTDAQGQAEQPLSAANCSRQEDH